MAHDGMLCFIVSWSCSHNTNIMATTITRNSLGEHRPLLSRLFPHILWPMSLTPNIARRVFEGLALVKGLLIEAADYWLYFWLKNYLEKDLSCPPLTEVDQLKDNIVGSFVIKVLWPSSLENQGSKSPSLWWSLSTEIPFAPAGVAVGH